MYIKSPSLTSKQSASTIFHHTTTTPPARDRMSVLGVLIVGGDLLNSLAMFFCADEAWVVSDVIWVNISQPTDEQVNIPTNVPTVGSGH